MVKLSLVLIWEADLRPNELVALGKMWQKQSITIVVLSKHYKKEKTSKAIASLLVGSKEMKTVWMRTGWKGELAFHDKKKK